MKKISLTLSFLLLSNINLYAAHFTDANINTILENFECIEDVLVRNPELAQYSLSKLQIDFGLYDDFNTLFGERYANLKEKIITTLAEKKSYISAHFTQIVISISKPGIFPHLARTNLKNKALSIDANKNSKDALEEALNENKYALLQGIVPDNQIDTTHIQVKDFSVTNSGSYDTAGFNTKYEPTCFEKKPLELNLDKLQRYTHSHISVTLRHK